jgi:hypothetical protein
MATLTTDQYKLVYADGVCGKSGLYSVRGVTAGDTMDIGMDFKVIKRAGLVSETGTTIASATFAGTVVTIPTGPAADGVWLLVVGVSI